MRNVNIPNVCVGNNVSRTHCTAYTMGKIEISRNKTKILTTKTKKTEKHTANCIQAHTFTHSHMPQWKKKKKAHAA